MDIATLRSKFREATSSMATDLPDASLDAYLNRAYRFILPAAIPGPYFDTTWSLTTIAGTASYAYPAWVVAPHGRAWISSSGGSSVVYPLDVRTDPTDFEYLYALPGQTGQPTAILFYGRVAKLSPTPDAAYVLSIPVRGGAEDDLANGDSIDDEVLAKAVIHAAAVEYQVEYDDTDGANKNQAEFERWKSLLLTRSLSVPQQRQMVRSF